MGARTPPAPSGKGTTMANAVLGAYQPGAYWGEIAPAPAPHPVRDRLAFDSALRSPPGKRFADKDEAATEIARHTYNGMTAAEVVEIAGRR